MSLPEPRQTCARPRPSLSNRSKLSTLVSPWPIPIPHLPILRCARPHRQGSRHWLDMRSKANWGAAGMGVVFRAWQQKFEAVVALKMLTGYYGPSELKRFFAEAETAAALHHANIVHIYDVGEHEGAPFLRHGICRRRLTRGPLAFGTNAQRGRRPSSSFRSRARSISRTKNNNVFLIAT